MESLSVISVDEQKNKKASLVLYFDLAVHQTKHGEHGKYYTCCVNNRLSRQIVC